MFDTMKFGKALSTLRKQADMTQNEVADRLNLSRQAISKYERGESFPDISILIRPFPASLQSSDMVSE